jgi:hypothetical protein
VKTATATNKPDITTVGGTVPSSRSYGIRCEHRGARGWLGIVAKVLLVSIAALASYFFSMPAIER